MKNGSFGVHDIILTLAGVDPTDAEAVAQIKDFIAEFYEDNPSVTVFIERIVNAINSAIKENARAQAEENGEEFVEDEVFQIDLKEIVDAIQVESGMTTAEIVKMLNDELQGSGFVLPAPELGETIYDYLSVYLEAVTLDAIVQAITEDTTATFASVIDGVIELSKDITLKDAINLVGNLAIEAIEQANSVVTDAVPGSSLQTYAETDKDGVEDVPGQPEDETTQTIDFVAILEELNLNVDALTLYFAYASDDLDRPTSLTLALNAGVSLDVTTYPATEDQTEDNVERLSLNASVNLSCSFEYTKPLIEFKIPSSVLDYFKEYVADTL